MAINRESNAYTVIFASIMVVVVGGLLAFVSTSLKPVQKANIKNEKMQNILQACGIEETAGVSRDEAGKEFNKYITKRITIGYEGDKLTVIDEKSSDQPINDQDKMDAFNIDMRKEYSTVSDVKKRHWPIFICEHKGETYYIVSTSGKGLWDDIWGYICLKSDGNTINGAVFDHKGETPGLGSKIAESWFEDQFVGKTIADSDKFTSVRVIKPGPELGPHTVNGISGATFTSAGVTEMLTRNLQVYEDFFKSHPDYIK